MPANVDTATPAMERCASCDASLSGPYCSRCGERALEPEALTLRHFLVHTAAHELLHVDGALWRTLRLLSLRPGRLSLEYAAGRRRPYVNPFRLPLIAIVAYTLIRLRSWLGAYLFLLFGLVSLWQFAYMAAAIRRFYLAAGRWGARLLSVAAAMLIYLLNTVFMTAVQLAGAAIALAMF